MAEQEDLKTKILRDMVVDHSDSLEKNYVLAKELIRITKDGKVDVLVKDRLPGTEKIILYLIGKCYAQRAGLTNSEYTKNDELRNELGIIQGSLLPWLKTLRDSNTIKQGPREGNEVTHAIALSAVERTLKEINNKLSGPMR
ncbi:MAG TPA: hypothetical protein VND15_00945 [Candidatus Acidoferrales bacterium]|nr:hypothetical protein [Candidatus Acidoferrales bacterium]